MAEAAGLEVLFSHSARSVGGSRKGTEGRSWGVVTLALDAQTSEATTLRFQ